MKNVQSKKPKDKQNAIKMVSVLRIFFLKSNKCLILIIQMMS